MPYIDSITNDLIQPVTIEQSGLRGRLIRMGPAISMIIHWHRLSNPVSKLMAEFVGTAATLSANFKLDGGFHYK